MYKMSADYVYSVNPRYGYTVCNATLVTQKTIATRATQGWFMIFQVPIIENFIRKVNNYTHMVPLRWTFCSGYAMVSVSPKILFYPEKVSSGEQIEKYI